MTAFIDKLEVFTQAIALDVDEECSPVVYLESTLDGDEERRHPPDRGVRPPIGG